VPLQLPGAPAAIYLKLENLQPIGSFKIRGAGNALASADPASLRKGVVTASAGNHAQGLAFMARKLGVACHVVVPDHAPATKLDAIRRLGGHIVTEPFERWWQVLEDRSYPGLDGLFVHPVSDPAVIAGNGTIGVEIAEDLPEVDAVVVPFGGGGLSCGIASALRVLRPDVPVYAAEVSTAAPLSASLAAGRPTPVRREASFVDGIGAGALLDEMWPLARELLAGSLVVDLDAVGSAVSTLITANRVVAEGAGAVSVAAALKGGAGSGTVVCVVSGGNIDPAVLASLLA
jgi:threonine dehydratase